MKRRLLSLSIILLVVLTVVPVVAQEPVTIRMSTWAGVDEAAELQLILDEINASQSDYQIIHEPVPNDYYTQMKTQLAGNTGADLYWVDQENMALKSEGVFMDLTDCLAGAEAGTAGDVNDYYPGILSVNEFEGGIYGLPWIAQPVVTYYNRSLFEAAGVEEPTEEWTWNDFIEKAQSLTQDTDGDGEVDQWGFTNNSWPPPYIFIWQAGGDIINADFTEAPVDSPEFLSGLEFWLNTAYNPEVSPSRELIAEQGFGEMFKAGKIAMFMGGAADDLDRVEGMDVGVVRVPGNPDTGSHTTFAWNASTVINAQTAHPEEA
jgi:multiple sugar transport system substrate-binding protein